MTDFIKVEDFIKAREPIAQGARNDTLYKWGHVLRKEFGQTDAELEAALQEINQSRCIPPLSVSEVAGIAQSIGKSARGMPTTCKAQRGKKATKTARKSYVVQVSPDVIPVDTLLSKEVSIYPNCWTNTPCGTATIGKVLETFRTGGNSKELIEAVREETDKERRNDLKKGLHAIVIGSEPQTERKATACVPNGILYLDFDGIPADELESAKAKIAALPYVFAVILSVSGTGLFALALYEGTPELKHLLAAVRDDFPYELDKSCSDVSRLRIITLDENLIVKDEVRPAILTEQMESVDDSKADSMEGDIDVADKTGIEVLDSFLQQVETIPFSASESGKVGHNDYYIGSIDHLLRTARLYQWDIGMRNGAPYFYNGRFWQRIAEDTFRHFLQAVGVRQGIPRRVIKDHLFVDKLVKQFASEARFPVPSTNDAPTINLRNGTLHISSGDTKLKPFDKLDGLCYQLDYDYNESATAPQFKKFIERVLPDQAVRKLIAQYIAYVFLRSMILEKVLFLYGSGANGKSVLLNIIRALIGDGQCCEFSLEGITEKECQRAELGHYLLNVSTEISTRLKTEIFKKIASREPLQARYLYK